MERRMESFTVRIVDTGETIIDRGTLGEAIEFATYAVPARRASIEVVDDRGRVRATLTFTASPYGVA